MPGTWKSFGLRRNIPSRERWCETEKRASVKPKCSTNIGGLERFNLLARHVLMPGLYVDLEYGSSNSFSDGSEVLAK
jgi:hypothetical protein